MEWDFDSWFFQSPWGCCCLLGIVLFIFFFATPLGQLIVDLLGFRFRD